MRGEVAYGLWIANEWAFNQTHNHMKEGIEKGKGSTEELVKLITRPVKDEATSLALLEDDRNLQSKTILSSVSPRLCTLGQRCLRDALSQ